MIPEHSQRGFDIQHTDEQPVAIQRHPVQSPAQALTVALVQHVLVAPVYPAERCQGFRDRFGQASQRFAHVAGVQSADFPGLCGDPRRASQYDRFGRNLTMQIADGLDGPGIY